MDVTTSMDFWQKVVLQAVGPLVTAVVGTLIVGTFVAWITRQAQERRADSQLREERIRSDNQLRLQLIAQMTDAASALYMTAQNYWRKKDRENVRGEELLEHRRVLEKQYRESRIAGEVIERRLDAYFSTDEPRLLWHGTMDLLTVRYFNLIDLMTDALLNDNAGEEHSGLTVEQLRNQKLLLTTYREKLVAATRAVLRVPLRPLAS